jgi:23S rRNA (uridine2552-2'-O)-methyltransferase
MVLGLLLLENTVYGKSITRWASVSNQIRTTSSKSGSSSRYLARQKKDSFVRSRLEENYVSRSAYKLLQLDGALRFLKKAKNVVDLGASPGGWTQVVMEAMRAKRCNVFALDLLDLSPLVKMTNVDGNLVFVKGDFTSKAVQDELQEALTQRSESNATVDVVLSDMMGEWQEEDKFRSYCEIYANRSVRFDHQQPIPQGTPLGTHRHLWIL